MKLEDKKIEYGPKLGATAETGHPTSARDLLKVDPKTDTAHRDFRFSLAHLTTYSVYWLTIWDVPTTYENISVLNARLFPSAFALAGFPEFPDTTRTLRTLLQMRPKYRGFATSDPRKGVFLTEKGREAASKVLSILGGPTFEGKAVEQSIIPDYRGMPKGRQHTRNPAQIIADAKEKLLYRRFKEDKFEDTDIVHFLGLISLYDHTPPVEIRREFKRLRDLATSLEDRQFLDFLDVVQQKFRAYLERPDRP